MNKSLEKESLPERLLQSTGGWYLTIVVFITQIISSIGTLAADYLIQVNAEFSSFQLSELVKWVALSWIFAHASLLIGTYFFYGNIRFALEAWQKKKENTPNKKTDTKTWNQLTSFSGLYSIFLAFTLFVFIFPAILSQVSILDLAVDQLIYTLLGMGAAILSSSIYSLFLLEYLLKPAYKVL